MSPTTLLGALDQWQWWQDRERVEGEVAPFFEALFCAVGAGEPSSNRASTEVAPPEALVVQVEVRRRVGHPVGGDACQSAK